MPNDKSVMSTRQAAELDHALERSGWNPADVKTASGGDILNDLLLVVRGIAEVNLIKHIIDCNGDPICPVGYKVDKHLKMGKFEWKPDSIQLVYCPGQPSGDGMKGDVLYKEMSEIYGRRLLNATFLQYLLEHPELIPVEWRYGRVGRETQILFLGTTFRDDDGVISVWCLYWNNREWLKCTRPINRYHFLYGEDYFTAVVSE